MKPELYNCISGELNNMRTLYHKQETELKKYGNYRDRLLLESRRDDYSFYYEKGVDNKRLYLGSDNCSDVRMIKRAHHLDQSLSMIGDDIKMLEDLLSQFSDYDYESVESMLPKAYRSKGFIDDSRVTQRRDVSEWLREKNQFKEEFLRKYPDRYASDLGVQRANGEWMRSRAECMIADCFDLHGIPYVYELPHYCNGKWIRSDFTALSLQDYRTEIIVEHLGLLENEKYRFDFSCKVADYMAAGYRPNIDLFFTFENLDHSFSLVPLQIIIDNWLK